MMKCFYQTANGVEYESLLLCSGTLPQLTEPERSNVVNPGWWGFFRHANSLILSCAKCALFGMTHLLPWKYAIFMTILLARRCLRDEKHVWPGMELAGKATAVSWNGRLDRGYSQTLMLEKREVHRRARILEV